MTVKEVHEYWRLYGQQMGMQNVRSIMPREIDNLVNDSILEEFNLTLGIRINYNRGVILPDSIKVGLINTLVDFYKVAEIDLLNPKNGTDYYPFIPDRENYINGKLSFNTVYPLPIFMYAYNFAINNTKVINGWSDLGIPPTKEQAADKKYVTSFKPIRVIEESLLANTLNDYVAKPSFKSPVMVSYTADKDYNNSNSDNTNFELYIGDVDKNTFIYKGNLSPYKLRFSYIKRPIKIAYYDKNTNTSVDPDIPDDMCLSAIKRSVSNYIAAVTGSNQVSADNAIEAN